MIAAGIDIGTNTALMVVASILPDGMVQIVEDVHELPRLGEGLDRTGMICDAARNRGLDAMRRFRDVLHALAPSTSTRFIAAVATSALREATNGDAVRSELEDMLGWPIEVIPGDREATLTFAGAVGVTDDVSLMIDIGGGSTEYACGAAGTVHYAQSTSIGVVRFTERYSNAHPISGDARSAAREHVRAELRPHGASLSHAATVVATAGTPTALAMIDLGLPAFDAARIEGYVLSRQRVTELSEYLCSLTLDELRAIPGLDERRADIVPMGSLILSESLTLLGYDALRVTTRGLRYGALLKACETARQVKL